MMKPLVNLYVMFIKIFSSIQILGISRHAVVCRMAQEAGAQHL